MSRVSQRFARPLVISLGFLPPALMLLTSLRVHGIYLSAAVTLVAALAGALMLRASIVKRRAKLLYNNIPSAFEALLPKFYLYWSVPVPSVFQIKMWLPFLQRTNKPFAIVVRSKADFRQLSAAVDETVTVIWANNLAALDRLIVPSVTSVFYVNNSERNAHAVRFNQLTHIQLLHGDSEKASSYNPVTAMYDRVYVAGQAGIDRYADNNVFIPEKI